MSFIHRKQMSEDEAMRARAEVIQKAKPIEVRCPNPLCGNVQSVRPEEHIADIRCNECGNKILEGNNRFDIRNPRGSRQFVGDY